MIGRIIGWIGGSLLTGALALATTGAAAQHGKLAAAPAAQEDCGCAAGRANCVVVDVDDALAALDLRNFEAPELASQSVTLALEDGERALEEAQEAAEESAAQLHARISGSGWLGIRMEEVSAEKAKELKLPAERGVVITYVAENSPAAKAGLKVNDVITEFDGQRVEGTLSLQRLVHETPAGRTVTLAVWREGRAQSLSVEVGSRRALHYGDHDLFYVAPNIPDVQVQIPPIPPIPPIQIGPFGTFRAFGAPALGIDAEDLSGQLGKYFGAPDGEGILVREVMPGTPAEKAGVRAGDVILRMDGKRVKDAAELRSALRDKLAKAAEAPDAEKAPAPTADLTILRSGKELTVRVELQQPLRRTHPARRVAV
jgi:S1-C subfamily serine protease